MAKEGSGQAHGSSAAMPRPARAHDAWTALPGSACPHVEILHLMHALVVGRLALILAEKLDGGVARHPVLARQVALGRGVHDDELHLALELLGGLLPRRLQRLAVPAPRRKELDRDETCDM